MLEGATYQVPELQGDAIVTSDQPALTSINERLRDDYREDSQRGVDRWNKSVAKAGVDFEITLPHQGFHRNIGNFQGINVSPEGKVISREEWDKNVGVWLPNDDDKAHIQSLMVPVADPGKMAGWIAPPARGIHGQDVDFEYVKFH